MLNKIAGLPKARGQGNNLMSLKHFLGRPRLAKKARLWRAHFARPPSSRELGEQMKMKLSEERSMYEYLPISIMGSCTSQHSSCSVACVVGGSSAACARAIPGSPRPGPSAPRVLREVFFGFILIVLIQPDPAKSTQTNCQTD